MSHLGIVTYLCMFSFLKVKFMLSFVSNHYGTGE